MHLSRQWNCWSLRCSWSIRLSALLQLHLHSQLNTWFQRIGQRQLQDETRHIYVWRLSAAYIRELTVVLSGKGLHDLIEFTLHLCTKTNFDIKTVFPGTGIPIIKIRQSWYHLIFIGYWNGYWNGALCYCIFDWQWKHPICAFVAALSKLYT